MKIVNLLSKLKKMNIDHAIVGDDYNKDIVFSINGLAFKAGFQEDKTDIQDFCREICFDNTSQETQRRFFTNFNQLLKYANYSSN